MHTTDPYPRIAVSKDGDALISEGPAMPALFISRQKLKSFLDSTETTTIAEISGVGAAAISACLEAQARFEALTESPSRLLFTFGNGLRVLYSEDGAGIDRPTGSGASSIDIIVTPRGAQLTGAKAVSRLDLRSLPSPPARDGGGQDSYAWAVTQMVRSALQKRHGDPNTLRSTRRPDLMNGR